MVAKCCIGLAAAWLLAAIVFGITTGDMAVSQTMALFSIAAGVLALAWSRCFKEGESDG